MRVAMRIARLALVFIGLSLINHNEAYANKPFSLTEGLFREAVSLFLDTGDKKYTKDIVEFITKSDKVNVVVSPETAPWVNKGNNENSALLLVAFLAGNALSQLDSGIKRSDPYSGTLQVFRLYRRLQTKNKKYQVPEIEELFKLHQNGKLISYFEKISSKQK
jgi:hypothetical protein